MRKNVFILLLSLICAFSFAQKIVKNPNYGLSSVPGSIVKIELLDTATVVHFQLKTNPTSRFLIPKKTFIQDFNGGGDKLFVTGAEGVKLSKWHTIPESGEQSYKLFFPKLDKNVNTIDFGEANDGGTWAIYDIVINEIEGDSILPKEIIGNWMLADGSNRWDYTFNSKNAIVDRRVWSYKSVENKGKKYTLTLENSGDFKIVYAKLSKNGHVDFGLNPKTLHTYSLEEVHNPNFKLDNDALYEASNILNKDSAIYSGVIKGYTERANMKTGMVYVNNAFTGNQESNLVKISNDGRFSIKFNLMHPQPVFVRMAGLNESVFIEPGKETFHFIDGKKSLFMGDCAQVNSDLQAMKDIRYFDYQETMSKIGVTSPEAYKKICFDVRDKELKAVKALAEKQFISNKALQVKKIDVEYGAFEKVSGYGMYRGSLERRNKSVKTDKQKKPFKSFIINKSFYDFVTPESINNKLAVLSTNYNYFINRLVYADVFKADNTKRPTIVERVDWLQNQGIELSLEELKMAEASKEIETPEVLIKQEKFRKVHGSVEQGFYKKYAKAYQGFSKENKEKSKFNHFVLSLADYAITKGDTLSEEEVKMIDAVKKLKTDVELENEKEFNEIYGKIRGQFYKKHSSSLSGLSMHKHYSAIDKNIKDYFGDSDAFLYDIITFQRGNKRLEDYNVYTDNELKVIQQKIKDPFLVTYMATANEATKEKIELNKTKGDYSVNAVENTEGDELFNAMIKKFKGKVIYVDFWATWCGPCKSGMKKIEPLKEEMKNEDVVFLYITNQTSPEGTWKNSIANIKGEHYRVTKDEWNYLSDKFKISGIPHYTLVNKKGEVVKPKMRHNSNVKLKTILSQEIKKEI
ncbi:MAG: TlpA disulfide reductase family protein [Algibacter sp.]